MDSGLDKIANQLGTNIVPRDIPKVEAVLEYYARKSQGENVTQAQIVANRLEGVRPPEDLQGTKLATIKNKWFETVNKKYPELLHHLFDTSVVNVKGILTRMNNIAMTSEDDSTAISAGKAVLDVILRTEKIAQDRDTKGAGIEDTAFEGKSFKSIVNEMRSKKSGSQTVDAEFGPVSEGNNAEQNSVPE